MVTPLINVTLLVTLGASLGFAAVIEHAASVHILHF